jgi:hypothetical protein
VSITEQKIKTSPTLIFSNTQSNILKAKLTNNEIKKTFIISKPSYCQTTQNKNNIED